MAKFRLIIDWGGPGSPVSVSGPIGDKGLCYAMLGLARDAIQEHVEKQKARVVVANTLPAEVDGKGA